MRHCDEEQHLHFPGRIHDPLKRCELSPLDLESRRGWEQCTKPKEAMLEHAHIAEAPSWVGQAVSKKRARLNCIAHPRSLMPCEEIAQPLLPARAASRRRRKRPCGPAAPAPRISWNLTSRHVRPRR